MVEILLYLNQISFQKYDVFYIIFDYNTVPSTLDIRDNLLILSCDNVNIPVTIVNHLTMIFKKF